MHVRKKKVYLCADHFEPKFINKSEFKTRLSFYAIPKNYLSGETEILHCKINICQNNENVSDHVSSNDNNESLAVYKTKPKTYRNPFKELSSANNIHTYVHESQFPIPEILDISTSSTNFLQTDQYEIPTELLLRSPRKKKLKPNEILKNDTECILNKIMEGRSGSVKTFVKAQTMHTVNSKWTSEEKDLFLKFHYRSPSFYKFLLKEGFTLPSPSTIVRWYNTIEFSTGISIKILQMLNEKFKDTPELEKRCVLVFDEMSIKTELEYNTKEDCVYGFSDLGELGRERSFSEYALLFMLRGLNKPWKQVFHSQFKILEHVSIIVFYFLAIR